MARVALLVLLLVQSAASLLLGSSAPMARASVATFHPRTLPEMKVSDEEFEEFMQKKLGNVKVRLCIPVFTQTGVARTILSCCHRSLAATKILESTAARKAGFTKWEVFARRSPHGVAVVAARVALHGLLYGIPLSSLIGAITLLIPIIGGIWAYNAGYLTPQ